MNASQASSNTLSASSYSQPPMDSLMPESPAPNPDSNLPPKRKPGRPKGSGPKQQAGAEVKVKRPVGRPRKDGLPAGSVEAPRRQRKSIPGSSLPMIPDQYKMFFQPPLQTLPWAFPPSISAPPSYQPQIDPALSRDEWSFADSSSVHFLSSLINALNALYPPIPNNIPVQDAFKMHLNYLEGPATTPSFYHNMKTFWLPSAPMYFSLTSSTTNPQLPAPDYRFFFWDPHPLVFNGIQCPVCSQALHNRGRIQSGPIKIFDLERPYYIIAAEYICSSQLCPSSGHPFASTDSSIMKNLPLKLREEFRVVLLERGDKSLGEWFSGGGVGVSRALWDMVRSSLMVGMSKAGILEVLRHTQCGLPDLPMPPPPPPPPAAQPGLDLGQQPEVNGHIHDESNDSEFIEEDDVDSESLGEEDEAAILERAEAYLSVMKTNATIQAAAAVQQQQPINSPHPLPPNLSANVNINPGVSSPPVAHSPTPPHPPPGSHTHSPSPFYGIPIFPPAGFSPFAGYPFIPQPPPNQPPPPPHSPYFPPPHQHTPSKRPSDAGPDVGGGKRMRHCCKCGHNECKGKGGRSFCQNPCQDCGKLECRGRNSRRPDKKCSEAWD